MVMKMRKSRCLSLVIAGWLAEPDGSAGVLAKPDFSLRPDDSCRWYYPRDVIAMGGLS